MLDKNLQKKNTTQELGVLNIIRTSRNIPTFENAITALPGGGFIVAYAVNPYPYSTINNNLYAQIYNNEGIKTSNLLTADTDPTGTIFFSMLALTTDGFILAWQLYFGHTSENKILQGQHYNNAGEKTGSGITYLTLADTYKPAIAAFGENLVFT